MGFRFGEDVDAAVAPRRAPPPDSHHPDSYHSRQQRRISAAEGARDSYASTDSQLYSPVSGTFPPNGLAPRPPSYAKQPASAELARTVSLRQQQQEQRRRSQPRDQYIEGPERAANLPPTVPDASQVLPHKSRSVREGPVVAREQPARDRFDELGNKDFEDTGKPGEINGYQGRAYGSAQSSNGPSRRHTTKARLGYSPAESESVQGRNTYSSPPRDASGYVYGSDDPNNVIAQDPVPQPRREWAPDRSPLQKLELTLQDITKEEKRARVEEAELLAKERLARKAASLSYQGIDGSRALPLSNAPERRASQADPSRRPSARQAAQIDLNEPTSAGRTGISRNDPQPTQPRYAGSEVLPRAAETLGRHRALKGQPNLAQGLDHADQSPQHNETVHVQRSVSQRARGGLKPVHGTADRQQEVFPASPYHWASPSLGSDQDEKTPRAGGKPPLANSSASRDQDFAQSRGIQTAQGYLHDSIRNDPQTNGNQRHASIEGRGPEPKRRPQVAFANEGPLDEWRNAPVARLNTADLILDTKGDTEGDDKAWWERKEGAPSRRSSGARSRRDSLNTASRGVDGKEGNASAGFQPPLYLKCGPLLRYLGLRREGAASSSHPGNGTSSGEREFWRGSVMIVTTDSESSYDVTPTLRLFLQPMDLLPPPPEHLDGSDGELAPEYVDPIAGLIKVSRTGRPLYVKPVEHLEEEKDLSRIETDEGLFEEMPTSERPSGSGPNRSVNPPRLRQAGMNGESLGKFKEVKAHRLHAERGITFWRFNLEIELGSREARIGYRINRGPVVGFWVPAKGESMNIMFHSCNGFSLSVNPDQFSGPDPLWRDVLSTHQTRPFHVMIGGGDQIYNDAVTRQTTLFREWLELKNPLHKHSAAFTPDLREELESFYLERYSMWFSQGLFGMANSQIPMINIWDDHDIIDGFGSYPHHFMSTPVFAGLGAVAFKYYMLFQHQSVPSEIDVDEPSWLLGASPGPYITERSRSIFTFLGREVAFLGLDCRTERRREEVLTEQSYDIIFDRCHEEIVKGETKHLIVLLGVPIAYPRLVWLENLLTSRLMDPVKAIGRRGAFGGFLNQFDGGVEILDDLDDHWTAKNHKAERNWFIEELQELAAKKSVRITILGGDVHLAAIGQFYSNPKLGIPKDRDHRYMPNVISSAIVNTPPPEMMGDILNKRNRVHHFDPETDEDMIPMFTHDVDGKPRNNKRLLPRRNWCSIRPYNPGHTPPPTPPTPETYIPPTQPEPAPGRLTRTLSLTRKDILPSKLFRRNSRAGPHDDMDVRELDNSPPPRNFEDGYFPTQPVRSSTMPADEGFGGSDTRPVRPTPFHRRTTGLLEGSQKRRNTFPLNNKNDNATNAANQNQDDGHIDLQGGLDIVLNLEVSQKDPAGITTPYRLLVPALWYEGPPDENPLTLKSGQRWKVAMPKFREVGSKMKRRASVAVPARFRDGGLFSPRAERDSDSDSDSDVSERDPDDMPPRGVARGVDLSGAAGGFGPEPGARSPAGVRAGPEPGADARARARARARAHAAPLWSQQWQPVSAEGDDDDDDGVDDGGKAGNRSGRIWY